MFFIFELLDYCYKVHTSIHFDRNKSKFISIITKSELFFIFIIKSKLIFICFTCRTSGGRLHLISDVGKIPLADATLIEEPNDSDREDESMNPITLNLHCE